MEHERYMFDWEKRYPWFVAGCSTRSDGPMIRVADSFVDEQRRQNQKRLLMTQGIDWPLASGALVHGTNIELIDSLKESRAYSSTDGFVTDASQQLLTVTVADCYPLFFVDPVHHTVGIAHAGWRGVVGGICGKMMKCMREAFGTRAEDLLLGIGPGIRVCHFEIQPELMPQFSMHPRAIQHREQRLFVDLPLILSDQFHQDGGKKQNIAQDGTCTFCAEDQYFSYRRDHADPMEVMMAYVGLK